MGGTPVAMPIPEIYDAMQKGVIDAVLTQPISAIKSLRLCEVAKYVTRLDLGCLMTPVLMPKGTWEKLPNKVQNEMMALAREMPEKTDEMISEKELNVMEEMKQEGILIYEISEEDKARIKAVVRNFAKTMVDDLKNKGVKKTDEGMTFYLNTIDKYSRR